MSTSSRLREAFPPHHLAPHRQLCRRWTPDGKDVLIASMASSFRHYLRFYRIHADGSGSPDPLPLPSGFEGSFSPDGQTLAYEPLTKWQPAWKRYHGGQTTPIWIVNLKTLDLVKVPRDNSTTLTRFGWVARSTSSPTATAPSRSSATTPPRGMLARRFQTPVSI